MPRKKRRRSTSLSSIASVVVVLLVVLLVLYQFLSGEELFPPAASTNPTQVTDASSEDWLAIYFTDPTLAETRRGGPDEYLAAAIEAARLSVDLAVLDLNLASLQEALLSAHRRGVDVRIVVDSDYHDEEEIQDLIAAGIPVLGDRRESLMHNKFTIIDRAEVWTGSMNYTYNDAYRNNNNLVRIRSAQLAEDYQREFEEMFVDDLFGPSGQADTPHPQILTGDTLLEVFFSPDDGTAAQLVKWIQTAEHSLAFMAYSFTSDDLAGAILERAEAGVTVAGIMDAGQYRSNTGTEYDRFRSAGLDVRLDGNPHNLHHKVLIIDEKIIVTGSYNFSSNAERRNDENTLIIHSPEAAAAFLAEFQSRFAEAEP
jgi:phosphatidylserine/phosphatidylglycerophosphate/cardiolipin synthase-like enzyme